MLGTGGKIMLILWSALVWIPTFGAVGQDPSNEVGNTVGVGAAFVAWTLGMFFFGILAYIFRPRTRPCMACGEALRKKEVSCRSCGFDARALAATFAATGAAVQSAGPALIPPPPPPDPGTRAGGGSFGPPGI